MLYLFHPFIHPSVLPSIHSGFVLTTPSYITEQPPPFSLLPCLIFLHSTHYYLYYIFLYLPLVLLSQLEYKLHKGKEFDLFTTVHSRPDSKSLSKYLLNGRINIECKDIWM